MQGCYPIISYLCTRNPARVRYTEAQASARGLYFVVKLLKSDFQTYDQYATCGVEGVSNYKMFCYNSVT